MSLPITKVSLKQEFTGDRQTNQIQTNAYDSGKVINACPLVFGRLLETESEGTSLVFVAATARTLDHKLKRTPNGYIIVDMVGGATFVRGTTNELTISLTASANTTVKIWVW